MILVVIIAFISFIVMSLPGGMLGVAWPAMRDTFQVSLDALGALLLTAAIGRTIMSFVSGQLINRVGLGRVLLFGSLLLDISLIGYVVAPSWQILNVSAFLSGIGGGMMVVGINAYFAKNHSPRLMNWLHASFGVGITIGPVVMTVVLDAGGLWRWGYVVALILQLIVTASYILIRQGWRLGQSERATPDRIASSANALGLHTLKFPVVWLGMLLFFTTSGTEATVGSWAFSLLHEARGVPLKVAGLWVSVYWGSFTVSRVLFGLVINRLNLRQVLRVNMFIVGVGGLLIWLNFSSLVNFLGLILIGFALAPVFPLLVLKTPERVGQHHAENAISYQIGSASLGLALLPGITGILANNISLEVVGPVIIVAASMMIIVHETIIRRSQ
ncbi:MAG: MFS transporter [Anaerolineales bacterium]|nr:MFS transporter [Anaerolineales bacterium]